jgi:phosphoglycolate phosphatase-like HAD superfamily hydrolase
VKLLLFDIDGTLILTGGAGIRALNRAFSQVVGIVNAMDGIRPHGKTDPAIIREVFKARGESAESPQALQEILDTYVKFLPEEVCQSSNYRIMPGIVQFLADFRSRADLLFGLATGNVERGARIKLERGDLNQYFLFGGFGSDAENRAEIVRFAAEKGARHAGQSVDPRDVFVIGDTPRDIDAGREAGFRTIGVATSDYSKEQLEAAGAELAVADFERGLDQFLRTARIV